MLTVRETLPRVSRLSNKFRLDRLINIQNKISKKVKFLKCRKPETIAGVDVGLKEKILVASITLFSYPEMHLINVVWAVKKETFPYIPNFLAFRELPVILKAYKKLNREPDLIFVDGQGIAHPRKCGIATHLGVILNKPTIGCAKSYLFGDFEMPAKERGKYKPIKFAGEKIGIVLRTRDDVKPIFVSPGNKVDFSDCIKYTLSTSRFRIPEPIRYAHIFANDIIKNKKIFVGLMDFCHNQRRFDV
uniref:Endonuclease V n=1 Tax=candidate division WOR-3 bacterium TaxID=2052148 RepID=A0A7C6EGX4_UNCW3